MDYALFSAWAVAYVLCNAYGVLQVYVIKGTTQSDDAKQREQLC